MRERINEKWPWAGYYGGLFKALPGLVLNASNMVGALIAAVLLVLVIAGVGASFVLEEWRWQIGVAVGVIVLIGLARANYYGIERRDAEIGRLTSQVAELEKAALERTVKEMNSHFRKYAFQALIDAVDKGRDEILVPLQADPNPNEVKWTADVEDWDAKNVENLTTWWSPKEVEFYRSASGLISDVQDWRLRLGVFVSSKSRRLLDIAKRKTKYDDDK